MKFDPPLREATLIRRYKRFLADVLIDGQLHTVHCANTGSMTNCVVENSRCWLSVATNLKRKYPLTLEVVTTTTGHFAGVNTIRANNLVAEAIGAGLIDEFSHDVVDAKEIRYDASKTSRADFLLKRRQEPKDDEEKGCYLEVKSVTYGVGNGLGLFPDAKSERATRHLTELACAKNAGYRAALVFCVQHTGIDRVMPAELIDPVYASALSAAADAGVEILAYVCDISAQEIALNKAIVVDVPRKTKA